MTLPGGKLPFVFINVAMTADGKIAPANRDFVPFGSEHDRKLMLQLRSRADAVLSGATTVDQPGVHLGVGGAKYRELRAKRGLQPYHLRVIASGSGSISPDADIFQKRFSPIIILTTEAAGARKLAALRKVADHVAIFGKKTLDMRAALNWLNERHGVKTLLCEGGGGINAALFESDLVDEVYLTVCPLIYGGRDAPTLADGQGVENLADATRLKLKSLRHRGDELYLVYRVKKKSL